MTVPIICHVCRYSERFGEPCGEEPTYWCYEWYQNATLPRRKSEGKLK